MTMTSHLARHGLVPAALSLLFAACGGGDGGTDAAASPDAFAAPPSCEAYCASVMSACTADAAQYGSMDACLGSCAALELGTAADFTGDTIGCRMHHAAEAAEGNTEHCDHAGPMGAGECGENCEGFCAIAVHTCTGANEVWASVADCMTDCAMIDDSVEYNALVQDGNSLACRMYHLTMASEPGNAHHCDHIALDSPVCL